MQRIFKIKILLLLGMSGFFNLNKLNAQEDNILRFEHLTVDEGLPQNTVQGIVKDKYGFMWFGTWEGLCRYDGYRFKTYRAEKNNNKTLYNNRIQLIYKDKEGDLWIAGADTLISRYNYETDNFTRFKHKNLPKWLLDSLDRFMNTSFTFIRTPKYNWKVNQLYNILTRKKQQSEINNLLTQTNNYTGEKYIYHSDPVNNWALLDEYVYQMYLDDQDIFWVGTYSGGINKADLNQKLFSLYYKKYMDNNTLIDNLIRSFCEDKQGNLWIGTHNKGVSKLNNSNKSYTQYLYNKADSLHSISNNQIRKIFCDHNGTIWIGTKNGLDKYNSSKNTFKHYKFPVINKKPANWVYSIMEDHNNNIWIGTWTGIGIYDPVKDKFKIYNPDKILPVHYIRVVAEDKYHNIWVATEGGLAKLKRDNVDGIPDNFKSTIYKNISNDNNSLSDDRIYTMLCDDDKIWLGTAKGLNLFEPSKNKFTRFGTEIGIPDEFIVGIIKDDFGNLWVSHKKGLTRFNIKTHAVRNFSKLDGLQSNDFSEDAYYKSPTTGKIYFGGPKGYNTFFADKIKDNPYPPVVRLVSLKLNNKEINVGDSYYKTVILPKPLYLINKIEIPPLTKILSIEFAALHYASPLKNKYKYMLEGFDKEWISVDANDRDATYSNLPAGTYIFKVKASNCDGLWNETPTELTLIIEPPFYKTWWFISLIICLILLLFYLINQLRISQYKTIQEALHLEVKARTKELEEKNNLLKEKQELIQKQTEELLNTNQQLSILNTTKDKLFSIVAHDLRNPFNVVGGFSDLLINKFDTLPKDKIIKYINLIRVSSKSANVLLENLLDWSRMQTGRITFEPTTIQVYEIAEECVTILTGDLNRKNIQIENLIDLNLYLFADANMLKTIFRNIISNAIKFSFENSIIILQSNNTKSTVEISVIDNGIGMTKDIQNKLFSIDSSVSHKGTTNETGTGLGLIICKEFMEKHNGSIQVNSELNKGSIITLIFPVE
jgi:signal transduction histidine kinase/ligand-binding sensor domain-containing protein